MLNQNMRRDQRVKDFLAACHLTENNGSFTLLIRLDVYMTNNPLECRYWTEAYSVDDHVTFGKKHVLFTKRFQWYGIWLTCRKIKIKIMVDKIQMYIFFSIMLTRKIVFSIEWLYFYMNCILWMFLLWTYIVFFIIKPELYMMNVFLYIVV